MLCCSMVDLSLCVVSLDCWPVLRDCLETLGPGLGGLSHEVILVDNASRDGTAARVREAFPAVTVIENAQNVGFTKATNQAIAASRGRLILWLNPDTLVRPGSLERLGGFLAEHPRAGIVGPKVLNGDGSFQAQCRRGMPTPEASLYYFLGLHRLWPGSPRFGAYLLTHLPVDEDARVDAVSGCCLLARREVWDEIGPLDEEIPGFGEDIEWCVRAQQAGWEVWYHPQSVIVHLKGLGGVHARPFQKVRGIHRAMWVFYRKHLRRRYPFPVTGLVWLGVWSSFLLMSARVGLRRLWARQPLAGS
jgi:GT2 family glycosyltransferase